MVRDRTQSPISECAGHYCYPSGVCRKVFVSWSEKEGVLSATTCDARASLKQVTTFSTRGLTRRRGRRKVRLYGGQQFLA